MSSTSPRATRPRKTSGVASSGWPVRRTYSVRPRPSGFGAGVVSRSSEKYGKAHEARRPVVERDVEVPRGQHVAQALVDRAEQRRQVPHRPRGLGDAVGAGLRPLAAPREIGRVHLLLALALEEPGHEGEPEDRGREEVERHQQREAGHLAARGARSSGRSRPAGRRRRGRGRARRRCCPRARAGVAGPGWRRPPPRRRPPRRGTAAPIAEGAVMPARAGPTEARPAATAAPRTSRTVRAGTSPPLASPQAPSRSHATCR